MALELSINDLWAEAREIQLTLTRPTSTTILLSWNLPSTQTVYNGEVIVISSSILSPANQPSDGIRYTASTDLNSPSDTISGAQVALALYGTFGDNITTTSITLTNANPDLVYYASLHASSNILQYYPFGSKTYALSGTGEIEHVASYTGSIPQALTPPLNPTLGQVFYNPNTNFVQMWNGASWINALTDNQPSGSSGAVNGSAVKTGLTLNDAPSNPTQGQFFYASSNHLLYIWNGTNWGIANTNQVATPSTDKTPIGTDGSIDERVELINMLKNQLGYPAVCVELDESQFHTAIDIALAEFRRRADTAYERHHILFTIKAGQPTYYLNDPTIGTDRIVDIYKAHRVSAIGLNVLGGDNGIYAQIFYNQFFYGCQIDILSIHLAQSLSEEFEKIFAGALPFEWNEAKRELKFIRKLYKDERVVLECFMERSEQELLVDRWSKSWIRDWSLAKCWEQLGMSRSKYATLPGAGGGLSLNGDMLLQKSEAMYAELQRQINDYEVGSNVATGIPFLLA